MQDDLWYLKYRDGKACRSSTLVGRHMNYMSLRRQWRGRRLPYPRRDRVITAKRSCCMSPAWFGGTAYVDLKMKTGTSAFKYAVSGCMPAKMPCAHSCDGMPRVCGGPVSWTREVVVNHISGVHHCFDLGRRCSPHRGRENASRRKRKRLGIACSVFTTATPSQSPAMH